jgi:hypothetical protein
MTVLSLTVARWITQVMLASSAGVLRFDGPAPVSLPLLSLEPMVVLDQHGVSKSSGCRTKGGSKTVLRAMEIGPMLGISCGGDGKQLLDLLTALDKEHCQEVSVTPSKRGTKGSRELKNLECSINFEGSNHGKGKRAMSVL